MSRRYAFALLLALVAILCTACGTNPTGPAPQPLPTDHAPSIPLP